MSKKITAFSFAVLFAAVSVVTIGFGKVKNEADTTYADINTYAAEETVSTTESLGDFVNGKIESVSNIGGIISDVSDIGNNLGGMMGGLGGFGDILGGSSGGIGDAFSGIGDALGGIMSGLGGTGDLGIGGSTSPTYDVNTETIGYIDVVPAVSDYLPSTSGVQASSTEAVVNETVDFAVNANPYTKPTAELRGGDKGDGVKWMQWIFIYTRYGLKDDGITGVFDEDTMAVVKKLQKENGLSVDGIVDDEVIDKIELLFFKATYTTSAPAVATQPTTQVATTEAVQDGKGNSVTGIIAIVIIIAIVWVVAIGGIIVLFVLKKKKQNGAPKVKNKTKKTSKKNKNAVAESDTVIESASIDEDFYTIGEMFDKLD